MAIALVVIKAVGNQCNLRCSYCYTVPEKRQTFMTTQVLEQVIKSIVVLDPLPIFFWSGGEPLLIGREFFERVLTFQFNYCGDRRFINSLQTNGILLDRNWVNFLKEHNFQIGISWDGHASSARVTVDGQNVTEKIWKAIELCLSEGLNFGVITVVTQQNVEQLPQIAEILYSKGIKNLLFKPYIGSVKDLSLNPLSYAKVMCTLLDLWIETGDRDWVLEPLYSFLQALSGNLEGIGCGLVNNCGNFLTIEYDGKITCCDFVTQPFVFGDVYETDLKEISSNLVYKKFIASVRKRMKKCLICSWQHICGGGCLHYRDFNKLSQKWGEYILCDATKEIFNYCKQYF